MSRTSRFFFFIFCFIGLLTAMIGLLPAMVFNRHGYKAVNNKMNWVLNDEDTRIELEKRFKNFGGLRTGFLFPWVLYKRANTLLSA